MNAPANTEMMTSAACDGASIIPGQLLTRKHTVRADVLAHLLAAERLTGMAAVIGSSTTRLAAVVHVLVEKYGWPIFTNPLVTGNADGRNSHVIEYFMLPSTIAEAMRTGAGPWCAQVHAARMKLRTHAAEAKRRADAINAARRARIHAGQGDLFGGTFDG